jgi:DNA-binding NtrC family response regulator
MAAPLDTGQGMAKILVVDDEPELRRLLRDFLSIQGWEIVEAADGRAAVEGARSAAPSVVLRDVKMPAMDGLEALRLIKAEAPGLPVIMLTASNDVRTAVEAMRVGAHDYLTKPFDRDDLVLRVSRALEHRALLEEVGTLRDRLAAGPLALLGTSRQMQDVVRRVKQVAASPLTVLVQGETGVGKELVARAIHQESPRRAGPFVPLDCGAMPETLAEAELFGHERGAFTGADRRKEGCFQRAHDGTLFLDELANIPPPIQAKLLRALQEREVRPLGAKASVPVDVRIVAASNVPLEREVEAGRFRQDLYYRISEFTIAVPPLRARPEDILSLAARFLDEAGMDLRRPVRGFAEDATERLLAHPWPGNVRELRNVIRRAALLADDLVTAEDLAGLHAGAPADGTPVEVAIPAEVTLKEARDRSIAEGERRAIQRALRAARGNKSRAARALQTDYKTLHLKMRRYGIRPEDWAAAP